MKKTNVLAMAAAAAVVAAGLVAPVAASASPPVGTHASPVWSKDDLVDGLVFASGPVAEKLGIEIVTPTDAPRDAVNRAEQSIKALRHRMVNEHAAQVRDAARLLTSGDPYKVGEGHDALAEAFRESVHEVMPEYSDDVSASARCGLIAACAVGVILAVVAGVAVAVVGEAAVVGHAAVYATQALWERNALWGKSAAGASSGGDVPEFSIAELNARIATELSA